MSYPGAISFTGDRLETYRIYLSPQRKKLRDRPKVFDKRDLLRRAKQIQKVRLGSAEKKEQRNVLNYLSKIKDFNTGKSRPSDNTSKADISSIQPSRPISPGIT